MAGHNQQHLIELDGNKPAGVLLAVSNIVQSSQVHRWHQFVSYTAG